MKFSSSIGRAPGQ